MTAAGNPTSSRVNVPLLSHAAAGGDGRGTPFPSQPRGGRCSPSQAVDTLGTVRARDPSRLAQVNKSDVANLVDDEQRDPAELDQFVLQLAGVVGVGESRHPLGGGGERDPVAGLAGADAQPDGQVRFAGAGRAEEDDVLLGGDEVQRAQVGDRLAFEGALMVEVEVFQRFSGREAGGPDAAFAAVGLAGGNLALQAGDQELFVGPRFAASSFGQPLDRRGQRGRLQRTGEEGQFGGDVAAVRLGSRKSLFQARANPRIALRRRLRPHIHKGQTLHATILNNSNIFAKVQTISLDERAT